MSRMDLVLRVRGPRALFTRPHLRADPMTYDCITPSAAKGILRALYWKPEFEWEIERIHVLAPIRYLQNAETHLQRVSEWSPDTPRTIRYQTLLKDVDYGIVARIVTNPHRAKRRATTYMMEAQRRIDEGQAWREPCLGIREHFCSWERLERESDLPASPIGDRDLGMMLFDLDPNDIDADDWNPIFFHATLKSGVMQVPRSLYDGYRKNLMLKRHELREAVARRRGAA